MKKIIIFLLTILSYSPLYSQTLIDAGLGYTPPKIWSAELGYDKIIKERLYCILKNESFIRWGETDQIYFNNNNNYWGSNDVMILFPASLDGANTYAVFGIKYSFVGSDNSIQENTTRIPDDLAKEDQIQPFWYGDKLIKGGIIRDVDVYDHLIFFGAETTSSKKEFHAMDIIVRLVPPGTIVNPSPAATVSETENTETNIVESQGQSYITTIIPRKEYSSISFTNKELFTNGIKSITPEDASVSLEYLDGLGRSVQTIQRSITPAKNDLVSLIEYDGFGREARKWLPASMSPANGVYAASSSAQIAAQQTNTTNGGWDARPYSKPVYEVSPLNRVIKQIGPGQYWQIPNKEIGISTANLSNITTGDSLSCVLYKITDAADSIKITKEGIYAAGELFVTRTLDEDNNRSYEFKDKLGQVVLTRQMEGNTPHDTYYVYDDFGNLRVVLPPLASDAFKTSISNTPVKDYAYIYQYDNRNRCIKKKIPACEWIYYVYDKADRLIFTQDGEQRKRGEWTFTIPDNFGRLALTGICKNILSYNGDIFKNTIIKADWGKVTSTTKGYSISGVALVSPSILTVNYYDSYEFMGLNGIPAITDTNFKPEIFTGYGTQYTSSYTGLLTGTLTGLLDGTDSFIHTVMYYDSRKRLIQAKSNNHLTGGIEKEYIAYNFTGQPTQRQHIHSATGKATVTEIYTYTYDHAGRLLTTTHQWNGKPVVTLAQNTYDELGRLKTNAKNNLTNLTSTYVYNVRSWTKSISSPLFSQTLYYNESYGGSKVLYNGNISAMDWTVSGDKKRGYAFSYDNLSRLTAANYLENGAVPVNTANPTAAPSYKTAYTYDKHGNMKTLQRYGKTTTGSTFGLIDNLTINHTGNQLLKVSEAIPNFALSESADFKKYATAATEYYYNANGAMYKDLNKGISDIQYNSLNLPRLMDIKSPVAEARNEYTYSASGTKLRVVQKWNPNYSTAPVIGSAINTTALTSTKTTDYVGNMIYENGNLKRILVEGGYIEDNTYHFYLTDHLGDNRVVAKADGTVIQRNHYYPFGMAFAETPFAEQGKQPYKYNGKEFDSMHGLNWYDYSARYYDSTVPVLPTADPHAENYYSWSPYVYVGDNPIRRIDPTGKDWGDVIAGIIHSVGSNATTGLTEGAARAYTPSNASHYNTGRDVGDVLSIVLGGAEMIDGGEKVAVGVAGSSTTAGLSLTLSAAGAIEAWHGSIVIYNAVNSLMTDQGRKSEANSDQNTGSKSSNKKSGSYTNTHESGKQYHGKGDKKRMNQSAKEKADRYSDPVVKKDFTPAKNNREAFKQESRRLDKDKVGNTPGHKNPNNYNQRESPGKNYRKQDGEL